MIDASPTSDLVPLAPLDAPSEREREDAPGARRVTATTARTAEEARLRAAIDAHFDAMWRFLRRMGVDESAVEDAAQQVLMVFARKLSAIAVGAERSFLFGTALRVAADARKHAGRAREIFAEDADAIDDAARNADEAASCWGASNGQGAADGLSADAQIDDRRARRILDEILSEMAEEMRAVFVMCEIEELTMAEASVLLELPAGTVASRLRRAREIFAQRAAEMRGRFECTNRHSAAGAASTAKRAKVTT